MARLVSDIINAARHNTNDEAAGAYRVSDLKMLGFAQDGYDEAISVRPDLLLGKFNSAPVSLTTGTEIPFTGCDAIALTYYVTARAEMADDENVNSNRMSQALTQFRNMLLGG